MRIKASRVLITIFIALTLVSRGISAYAAVDSYKARPEDTLWTISQKYKVPIQDIIKANPQIKNPNIIYPGQIIYVPYDPPKNPSKWNSGNKYKDKSTSNPTTTPAPATTPAPNASVGSLEEQVVALCNQERAKHGLSPLSINRSLMDTARVKAEDMRDKNYFNHNSPTYGTPFDMLKKFGIHYKSAGENIAKGQKTAQAVVDAWMASEGHRKNILSASFTHIGVGYAAGNGTTYWAQLFITQ